MEGGVWSGATAIPNAAADEIVSLAALPGSGAVLAWRSSDSILHTAVYDPGEVPPWSEPTGLSAITIVGPPAVASGALGARAELMFVDSTYIVQSSRLVDGAWTAPAFTGTSGERIAIATGP